MGDEDRYLIGFLAFLATTLISRLIASNGAKKLDIEKKAKLVDVFGGSGLYHYVFLAVMILGFYAIARLTTLDPQLSLAMYLFLLVGYVAYVNFTSFRKLKANDFPEDYIKTYLLSSTVRFIGVFIFFGLLLLQF